MGRVARVAPAAMRCVGQASLTDDSITTSAARMNRSWTGRSAAADCPPTSRTAIDTTYTFAVAVVLTVALIEAGDRSAGNPEGCVGIESEPPQAVATKSSNSRQLRSLIMGLADEAGSASPVRRPTASHQSLSSVGSVPDAAARRAHERNLSIPVIVGFGGVPCIVWAP